MNYNSNLGIAFTDGSPAFTPRGSISFDFPSGFSGSIDNPEIVGDGPRHTLAITTSDFTTYGNHCWPFGTAPRGGSATIEEWRPNDGVVRATFSGVPLNNCVTMSDSCQLDGTIETTGEGVFETLKAVAKLVLTELKRGAAREGTRSPSKTPTIPTP